MCDYLKTAKYSNSTDISEIDMLIDKLENDIKMLKNSSDINKDVTISNIETTIDLIRTLPEQFLIDTVPTDKRAKKILKQYDPKVIIRVFGSGTIGDFIMRLSSDLSNDGIACEQDAALLFLFHIAKKIEGSMKVTNYKSLVYRAYIVKYLNDAKINCPTSIKMAHTFHRVMNGYIENGILKRGSTVLSFGY